ncbi:hypothetical protein ACJRO7_025695 [Eucalyptus globulus]|uniref:adenine phosphoribosyltransferase n=1 Tax=Eucalyptus globulus TaxID=34317 RepID=A0ABD3KBV0_EUCGL
MGAAENGGDPRLKAISDAIRVVPHFPKPGIMFHDITTLLLDHKAFKDTVDLFVERYRDMGISIVAATGFLFFIYCSLALWTRHGLPNAFLDQISIFVVKERGKKKTILVAKSKVVSQICIVDQAEDLLKSSNKHGTPHFLSFECKLLELSRKILRI